MLRIAPRPRQWPPLCAGRAAGRAWRAPLRATPLPAAPVRAYAHAPPPPSQPFPPVRPLHGAIIIPGSVKEQPDVLVNRIEPLSLNAAAKNPFCVFLVTPAFAPWLLGESTFLADAVQRVYSRDSAKTGGRGLTARVQTLCAVVDKLPAGRALAANAVAKDVLEQRTKTAPSGQVGYEGIAYAAFPQSASVFSTSSPSPEKGAIDFTLSGQTPENTLYSDVWRLPLANTVFQTGTTSTMFLSTWRIDPSQRTLQLEKTTHVTHHGIELPVSRTDSGQRLSALSIPLVPLTYPRRVEGCMGNIIRRLTGDDGTTSVTASSELEKVVPEFFKARGEPAQPTTVWALVAPKSNKSLKSRTRTQLWKRVAKKERKGGVENLVWDRLWKGELVASNTLVSKALGEGARLHRVLSGGGGWGKKAGLLSLDPVPVSEEIPIRMEDATSGFEGPGDFSSVLTPVVEDGDNIQFFISPAPPAQETAHNLESLKALPKERAWGWELGTVPSTVDSIPGGSWQHGDSGSGYLAVFKHSFGALAEGGMTLTQQRRNAPGDPLSVFSKTTIDVPYSRLWTVELAGKEDLADDVGEQEVE
jgi:hypothetical protein